MFLDGTVVDVLDRGVTHIIVDGNAKQRNIDFDFSKIQDLEKRHVVTKEWFWASIEINGKADERNDDYAFPVEVNSF